MAPYEEVRVSGFEEFDKAVGQHKGKTIFAYFTGSKDAEGKSWCPDCEQGETGNRGCCPAEVVQISKLWLDLEARSLFLHTRLAS